MKKRTILMLCALLFSAAGILLRQPVRARAATPDKIPAAVVAAHFAARLVGNNGEFEIIGYYTFGETALTDLFSGPPSERTARASFRSERFRINLIPNGNTFQVSRQASADGSVPAVRIYFDPFPNRDFEQPDTFSTGVQVGVLRPRNTQGIMVPGQMFHLVGTMDVENIADFTFNNQPLNLGGIPSSLTITLDGAPPSRAEILEGTKFSVPLSLTAFATQDVPK